MFVDYVQFDFALDVDVEVYTSMVMYYEQACRVNPFYSVRVALVGLQKPGIVFPDQGL